MGRYNRRLRKSGRKTSVLRRMMKNNRPLTVLLSVVVVLITAIVLITPASTLEKDVARQQGGIDVPAEEASAGGKDQSEISQSDTKKDDGSKESSGDLKKDSKKGDSVSGKDAGSGNAGAKASDRADSGNGKNSRNSKDIGKSGDSRDKSDKKSDKDEKDDSFSAGELTYSCKEYDIEASYEKAAKIPDDTEMAVEEIKEKDDAAKYEKYYDKALEAVQKDAEEKAAAGQTADGQADRISGLKFARFYDITLTADGDEIEPDDKVKVTISYDQKKALEAQDSDHTG